MRILQTTSNPPDALYGTSSKKTDRIQLKVEVEENAPILVRTSALEGNATLFIRGDEVEGAWKFVDTIRATTTALYALRQGYAEVICCGDVEEGPHRDNLRDVGRRYADVVGLEEVLAYIETVERRNATETL